MSWLSITPREPIIARDGRPFSATQRRMRSLDWPYPSVLAGSLRTLLAKQAELEFTAAVSERLRQIAVAGPLPLRDGSLYFPAPSDIAVRDHDGEREWVAARPRELGTGGMNLPDPALLPVMLRADADDFKPGKRPDFWSATRMTRWLLERDFATPPHPRDVKPGCGFLNAPERDERTHVFIDAATGSAMDSKLFQTSGLDFPEGVTMASRAEGAGKDLDWILGSLDALHPLGGERRLARWQSADGGPWKAPDAVVEALADAKQVRLILATPAIFEGGWRPGWLGPDLTGSLANGAVELQLVGVSIGRWRPISGWNLESSEKSKPGPKAVQRAVPAGGVYFFRVVRGDASELAKQLWLGPVSDGDQNCRDGFGLALWGTWSEI